MISERLRLGGSALEMWRTLLERNETDSSSTAPAVGARRILRISISLPLLTFCIRWANVVGYVAELAAKSAGELGALFEQISGSGAISAARFCRNSDLAAKYVC
eukprot:3244367-Pleurochrysis_carterae.AAC.1